MTTKAQQSALDNALVASENQRVIGKCNMRINPGMKPKKPTYQVVLDALTLTTCYHVFLITAEVPVIYMHQFWATVNKHNASYRFKIDNKRFSVNVEVFREILNICPRIPGQEFVEPPSEEEALSFIRELGHSGEIKYITDVIVDHLHQPWRTFASIINKCLCGKVSGLDKIRLSRVQILWGMYYKKNLDFVALIWEDLAYQIDNKDSKKQDKMFYPIFTKIIIHHFLEKDKSISMRNRTFMHTARDDSLLGTMRFVSRHEDTQVYGAILPKSMTNQAMLDYVAYKTYYAIASGVEPPKSKKPKRKSDSTISSEETPSKKKPIKAKKDVPSTKKPATKPKPTKKKVPVKADRGKSLNVLSEVALSEDSRLKEVTKRSKKDFHISHASGSDEGTGAKPGVPSVPKYDSESNKESWGDSGEEDDDGDDDDNNDGNDDDDSDHERTESDRDENANLNQFNEEHEEEEEENVDEFIDKEDDLNNANEENEEELDDDQHNVSQEFGFEQEEEDAHVTLTAVHDTKKTEANNEIASLMDTSVRHEEPSGQTFTLFTVPITTIHPPPHFFNPLPQQATPTPTPTTLEATTSFPALPDFSSVFKFNDRGTKLETDLSEMKQVDQYAQVISSIPAIVDHYINNKLGEGIHKAIQSHNAECREDAQAEKQEYIDLVDSSMRTIIREEVNTQLPQILTKAISDFATPVIERNVIESLEVVVLARSSSQLKSTYEAAASLSEYELTKILLDKMEESKSHLRADYKRELSDALVKFYNTDKDLFETYGEVFMLKKSQDEKDKDQDPSAGSDRETKRRKSSKKADHTVDDSGVQKNQEFDTSNNDEQPDDEAATKNDWFKKPKRPPTPDPDWNKRKQATTERLDWHNPEGKPFASNMESTKDVYSRKRIIAVTRLTIIKRYDYGSQNKKEDLRKRTAYTAYSDPQGVIYVVQNNRNKLMCTDELHKFSDGTLDSVRTALHDITLGIRMEYLPKKK
ncbi:hypothetical protein Tco_0087352 [Tanacetum coccineum]